jgi:hypothetical protein
MRVGVRRRKERIRLGLGRCGIMLIEDRQLERIRSH